MTDYGRVLQYDVKIPAEHVEAAIHLLRETYPRIAEEHPDNADFVEAVAAYDDRWTARKEGLERQDDMPYTVSGISYSGYEDEPEAIIDDLTAARELAHEYIVRRGQMTAIVQGNGINEEHSDCAVTGACGTRKGSEIA